jgi:4-hydroxy-2-oxoheptanedioate aldolase
LNGVRGELEAGRQLVGVFVQSHDPASIEMLGGLGFDCVCIEAEHSAMGPGTIRSLVAAAELTPAAPLVRVAGNDPVLIATALDAGAKGVVVPRVESAAEAAAAVAAARYPPLGSRGIGPGRATAYGLGIAAHLASANAEILLAVQVETRAALADLDAILAVDGVDMIFVGPGDFAASLGIEDPADPDLAAAIASTLRRSKEAGRLTGIFAAEPEAAARRRREGVDLVVLGSDFGWMAAGARGALGALT